MIHSRAQLLPLVRQSITRLLRADPTLELPLPRAHAERTITAITYKNFHSGRYARFCKHEKTQSDLTPARYVERVTRTWTQEAARWDKLHRGDNDAWGEFRQRLMQAAQAMLRTIGVDTSDHAEDYADSVFILVRRAEYPFDVPLNGWAFTILRNEILNRHPRRDLIAHAKISIDAPVRPNSADETAREWQISDPHAKRLLAGVEDRDLIERLLRRLGPARCAVIIMTFFEERTDNEIAEQLKTSHGNVQTLRHRALAQMYQLLDTETVSAYGAARHHSKGRGTGRGQQTTQLDASQKIPAKRTRRVSGNIEMRKKK
ncbi:MAG: sigma-70 family RNA polymerase sigma factor [Anaerolineae bacterium]